MVDVVAPMKQRDGKTNADDVLVAEKQSAKTSKNDFVNGTNMTGKFS
jgi:hypothetical protein